jgi:UDP-N-acetyl-D-galactosamine dehydrogenase
MSSNIKKAIIGLGYVGLLLARLFATQYPVIGFDINQQLPNYIQVWTVHF